VRIPGAAVLGLGALPDEDDCPGSPAPAPPGAPAPPRRSRWRRALWGLGAAALVAAMGWLVGFSPVLGVRDVDVRGESMLNEQQVRAAAGIDSGTPLVRLGTGRIEDRVGALPEVASVRVSVSYPSTVIIEIAERVAVGYRMEGRQALLVDAANTAFRAVEEAPAGLPRLPSPPPAGEWSAADAAAAAACAEVAASLPEPLRIQVGEVGARSENSVELTLADGRTVIWGGSVRNEQKAALLGPLLGRDGTVFDISADGVVVVR
jgi:cell division protein FtsQ